MARDLRRCLSGAGIRPPYLLVGHSLGGIIARRFAVLYPGDVAGMVLIDSSHEDQARRLRAEGRFQGPGRYLAYALRRRSRLLGLRRFLATRGQGRTRAGIVMDMPAELADAGCAVSLTSRHRNAVVAEMLLMSRLRDQPPGLRDLPLTVLTAAGRDRTWMSLQSELASLSTSSTHIVAGHGGHYLQRDNPSLVKSAILDLHQRLEPDTRESATNR